MLLQVKLNQIKWKGNSVLYQQNLLIVFLRPTKLAFLLSLFLFFAGIHLGYTQCSTIAIDDFTSGTTSGGIDVYWDSIVISQPPSFVVTCSFFYDKLLSKPKQQNCLSVKSESISDYEI